MFYLAVAVSYEKVTLMSKAQFNYEQQALPLLITPENVVAGVHNPILVLPVYISWFNHSRVNVMLNGTDNHDNFLDAVWDVPGFGGGQMTDFKNFVLDESLMDTEVPKLQEEIGQDVSPMLVDFLDYFENVACEYKTFDDSLKKAITNTEAFRVLSERLAHAQKFVGLKTPDLYTGIVFSYFERQPYGVFTVKPEQMLEAIGQVSQKFNDKN